MRDIRAKIHQRISIAIDLWKMCVCVVFVHRFSQSFINITHINMYKDLYFRQYYMVSASTISTHVVVVAFL